MSSLEAAFLAIRQETFHKEFHGKEIQDTEGQGLRRPSAAQGQPRAGRTEPDPRCRGDGGEEGRPVQEGSEDKSASSNDTAKSSKKEDRPKKKRFQFFRDVKSEMKRVTWPTRTDVLRWSGVVVVALLFFGIFVALLDNVIITPLLVFISGIGA